MEKDTDNIMEDLWLKLRKLELKLQALVVELSLLTENLKVEAQKSDDT